MASRAIKPISVTLGPLATTLERHVASGRYASASEVVRAGLRALDREEVALDGLMRARVEEALADPRPSIPQDKVFAALRAHHAARVARDA